MVFSIVYYDIEKKFNSFITEGEKSTDVTLDDFIPYRKMFTAAVEELCHYHPMGVYYYVLLILCYKIVTFTFNKVY